MRSSQKERLRRRSSEAGRRVQPCSQARRGWPIPSNAAGDHRGGAVGFISMEVFGDFDKSGFD